MLGGGELEGAGGIVPARPRRGLLRLGHDIGRSVHPARAIQQPGRVGLHHAGAAVVPLQPVGEGDQGAQGQARIQEQRLVDIHLALGHSAADQGVGDRLGHGPGDVAHGRAVILAIGLEHRLAVALHQQGVGAAKCWRQRPHRRRPGLLNRWRRIRARKAAQACAKRYASHTNGELATLHGVHPPGPFTEGPA